MGYLVLVNDYSPYIILKLLFEEGSRLYEQILPKQI
jgi:hypothetical protein